MPWQEVMHKWKHGDLHSGSKKGPVVKNQKRAVAIMLSEKKSDKSEYHSIGPSDKVKKKHGVKHGKR